MLNRRSDKLELLRIAEAVALEKSIDKELIIDSMETGIAKAAKSKFGQDNEIKVLINRENGEIGIFRKLIVVEKPENTNTEINLQDAIILSEENKDKKIGDEILQPLPSFDKLSVTNSAKALFYFAIGLRNTKNLNKALSEAYRVLKPGGHYLCLEFSKIQNSNLDFIYKNYSKLIPLIGKAVAGQKEPYEYLIKSIEEFINQEELIDLMKINKFENCSYRNLSGGIVAIHSGWKI